MEPYFGVVPQIDARQERGQKIATAEGQVRRIDEHTYKVHSQSGDFWYDVLSGELGWICSCPDFMFRPYVERCKHVWSAIISLELRKRVERSVVIQPISTRTCPSCQSEKIIRKSVRHNKGYDLQRFLCRTCGKRFSFNMGFERMRASPQAVTSAMQLYFSGESFGGVKNFLALQGVNVSRQSVYNWVRKYVALMDGYLDQITPQLGDHWRADEMYVKFKGNRKYLFAMMDDETRFRIAQEVAHWKETHDASNLFRQAREVAEKVPKKLTTDGLKSYRTAFVQEFQSVDKDAVHVQEIQLDGEVHNNLMERQNGEVRDREKVMRGLKRMDTPILKGVQIYHNFIKPHEGLQGRTPAEAAGIRIEGEDKWKTLIQNAVRDDGIKPRSLSP